MDYYKFLWILIKYIFPVALFIYSVVKFNPFYLMVSILWFLATMVVVLINYSVKSNATGIR